MRQFVPSDYVDKNGNVYETVGENIREGKNGAITSDFPTPEEIGSGLVGSDGNNYVSVLKNLSIIPHTNIYAIVSIEKSGIMSWVPVINTITESNKKSYVTPSINAVTKYISSKIPNDDSNYSWVTVNVTYDGTSYSIDDTRLTISEHGTIYSDTVGVIELLLISSSSDSYKSNTYSKGFYSGGRPFVSFDIQTSYTAKLLIKE